MKIQYCSDLHLEFEDNKRYLKTNPILPIGEILILAGDIMLLKTQTNHLVFLKKLGKQFKAVYWIAGNHEYYHSDIGDQPNTFCNEEVENVFFVNNKTIVIKNVELIFSTLWSYIKPIHEWTIQKNVNDFFVIKKHGKTIMPADFNALHKTDLAFIESALATSTTNKRIVVTHHVPTFKHYPPQYLHSEINGAFATELFDTIEKSGADYWVYGHHHCNIPAFKIGKTTMLTNQLGYVSHRENELFDRGCCVEV